MFIARVVNAVTLTTFHFDAAHCKAPPTLAEISPQLCAALRSDHYKGQAREFVGWSETSAMFETRTCNRRSLGIIILRLRFVETKADHDEKEATGTSDD